MLPGRTLPGQYPSEDVIESTREGAADGAEEGSRFGPLGAGVGAGVGAALDVVGGVLHDATVTGDDQSDVAGETDG